MMALSVGFRIPVSRAILLPKLRGSDFCPGGTVPTERANLCWTHMSADRVLLAANDVLNRKFTPLVDDRREVCASNKKLIYSDGLRLVSERIDGGASK
jgi:hypothetical protein